MRAKKVFKLPGRSQAEMAGGLHGWTRSSWPNSSRKRRHWNRLLREVANASSLETFSQVGWASEQPHLVEDVPAHCRGLWTKWPLKHPSNPNHPTKQKQTRKITLQHPSLPPPFFRPMRFKCVWGFLLNTRYFFWNFHFAICKSVSTKQQGK